MKTAVRKKEETWIVIPARAGSRRLPNKAMLPIGGKPMIAHVVESSLASKIGPVLVATDHQAIADASTKAGARAIMTPDTLPSGSDRIAYALKQEDPDQNAAYIINLQGDIPFPSARDLLNIHRLLLEKSSDIVTLAAKIHDERDCQKPQIVKVAVSWHNDSWGRALYFSRHPLPASDGFFYHHIGIYGFQRNALMQFTQLKASRLEQMESLEQLRALEAGMSIIVAKTDHAPHAIDTIEDFEALNGLALS